MHMSLAEWVLALLAPVAQFALLMILKRRKLQSKYPFFFNYVAFGFISLVALLASGSYLSDRQYFYVYWAINTVSMVLGFVVLYEVFVSILKPFSALIDLGKMLFGWATAFLLLASVLTAFVTTGGQSSKICSAILLLERSVQLMQCGLLLLFVLFETRLGLSWRHHGMCVALGLGLSSGIDLISVAVRTKYPALGGTLDTFGAVSYFVNYAYWAMMFAAPEPARQTVQDSPTRLIFQRWNDTLLTTPFAMQSSNLAMASMDSFLPNVERTVERVMARKMTQ